MSDNTEVRTRFAPSPSGYLHVGGARTALFNYLYAKARGGKFILRVEDTDQERSTPESERIILDSLKWLGIHADEGVDEGGDFGPYRQSERLDVYGKYTKKLLSEKQAYPCFCTQEELSEKSAQAKTMGVAYIYDGKCRGLTTEEVEKRKTEGERFAIRFHAPKGEIQVNDLVQGRVKFDAKLIGDFIIVKSDGFPSYNYAVVVDDSEMKINYVIRGVGHLSNTPRQILIHTALGIELPNYAHISEIIGTDKKKLSKRRGATSVMFFKELGYLSKGFVNYMALLGWYPENSIEFMPEGELEKVFDVTRCSKAPATFDFFNVKKGGEDFDPLTLSKEELLKMVNNKSKLHWMNNKYIRHLSLDEVWQDAEAFIKKDATLAALLEKDPDKIKNGFDKVRVYLDNLEQAAPYMLEIFKEKAELEADAREILEPEEARAVVKAYHELLKEKKPTEPEEFSALMKEAGAQTGAKGKTLFMPIRCGTTGTKHGLELPTLFSILGADAVCDRIDQLMTQLA